MKDSERKPKPGPPLTDDAVGDLIRSAGRRPAPPGGDLDALRDTARSAWQSMAAQQRKRRLRSRTAYALAASLLIVLFGSWWWLSGRAPGVADGIATVELTSGHVAAVAAADPATRAPLGTGDRLAAGAVVETAGREGGDPGRVALRWTGGESLRLDAGTTLRLVSSHRIELERGAVYVDSGPSAKDGGRLEIVTALGTVREIGTQYEVRLEKEAGIVRVREGEVSLVRGGESHSAARGEQLTVLDDGSVARAPLKADDPAWDWVLATAPSLDIEGRSLASFLDWVARETGLEIRYADGELARSAETIRLHGTIDGLRPDEAIGVVLESSGLGHRAEGGVVLVFRP